MRYRGRRRSRATINVTLNLNYPSPRIRSQFIRSAIIFPTYSSNPAFPGVNLDPAEYNRPRQPRHVSVINVAETQKGIELLAQGRRRILLEQWLKQDLEAWSSRILPVDRQVAGRWALLGAQRERAGRPLPRGIPVRAIINPWEAA